MKTVVLCSIMGGLAFAAAAYQAGLFPNAPQSTAFETVTLEEKPAEPKPETKQVKKPAKARFPQDLARAVRGEGVSQAAAFDPRAKIHRIAILKTSGALFQDWQDKLKEEWQADSVENTSLIIIVGPQKKIFLERILYPGGAPPIDRFRYEMEASVVEAKTGRVLANRLFVNVARNIVRVETWDTTALGSPVEFRTVFYWMVSGARAGFPQVENPTPIVNVVN
jgi:hypothetical protein